MGAYTWEKFSDELNFLSNYGSMPRIWHICSMQKCSSRGAGGDLVAMKVTRMSKFLRVGLCSEIIAINTTSNLWRKWPLHGCNAMGRPISGKSI